MPALPFPHLFRNRPLPDDVLAEAVGLMFSSTGSIVAITAIYGVSAAAAAHLTGDPWMAALAVVGLALGIVRIGQSHRFNREVAVRPLEPAGVRAWQNVYVVFACLFSLCIGLLAGRVLMFEDAVSHMLVTVVAFAYGIGLIVRVAVRPFIAGVQVALLLFAPTVVAAANQGTVYFAALLFLLVTLLIASWLLIRNLYGTILERLLTRQDLRLARDAAEEASRAKTEFLASMSHEIRTPLNGIMGLTDLLLDREDLAAEARRQLELVKVSSAALLTVVNDVLDFSKIEAGAVELDGQPFWPKAMTESCAAMVRELAARKGLELQVRTGGLPNKVIGDEPRLRQVLLNLLNNAVKFTPAGRVELCLEHGSLAGGLERLRWAVTDTGIGIPEVKRARLFERFSQVDGSRSRQYGGSGLGLAISKRLVELMGGRIGLDSAPGRGTTAWFEVSLPRTANERASRPEPEPGPPGGRRGRLLLAEDVAINQEIATAILTKAGYAVDVVGDGAQAIQAVQQHDYDLVLMDVQMPVMDGIEATKTIRSLDGAVRHMPIIAMTANVYAEQIASFRLAGMDDHVGKPFKREELFDTIERWLPPQPGSPLRREAAPALLQGRTA
jgi:signal transduction histidine kinase/CheY-like chemotaxis protein